ncbi:MAG: GFA family protein [Alphaproteobacteria bacterium]
MTEGGCLCGQVRYRFSSEPLAVVVCHCRDCQKQSGSAFSVNVIVAEADIEVAGQETVFHVTAESGGAVERRFCARCGSPIRSLLGNMPGIAALKSGTLDIPLTVTPAMQIWRRSAQGWLDHLPALPGFETNPPAA